MTIVKIIVQGIVQGVGFRPTVYRIAKSMNLKGYVKNIGNAVEIVLFESEGKSNDFIKRLEKERPPVSSISSIKLNIIEKNDKKNIESILKGLNIRINDLDSYNDFKIIKSSSEFKGVSVIPSDIAICENCIGDLNNKNSTRYNYPFTACADCGPRFTVINSVPYDRERTSMDEFKLCNSCQKEYKDPLNRRYHAEATCCVDCGPEVFLYKNKSIEEENSIKKAVELLDSGKILAIKGIGGTHLVADVRNEKIVNKLRKRLNRPTQPFATMSYDLDHIKEYALISKNEEESLKSRRRPIVVVKKSENYDFASSVAPGLHNIGVMLPYTGLHYLMFKYDPSKTYIMTSANMPGEPMLKDNEEIISSLSDIADCFLLHNREIVNRCDDSVIRYRGDDLSFIRRSRGYAPEPYDISPYSTNLNILSLGPELDVTFAISKDSYSYISQHIGNTSKFETLTFLKEALMNMMNITKTSSFDLVVCDMHPNFFTTKIAYDLAEKYSCDVLKVQHHHAHAAALSIDNDVSEMICIAADGVGYGDDGTSWGGEILYSDVSSYERLGSLTPQKMPGGDLSTKYPVRMLYSLLLNSELNEEDVLKLMKNNYSNYFQYGEKEVEIVLKQIKLGLNIGISTSTGRILDSVSVALDICHERTYEGECSMMLESVASMSKNELEIPFIINKLDGRYVLDTSNLIKEVIYYKNKGYKKSEIASASQRYIANGLSEIAIRSADKKNIDTIGASGGVFYNEAISIAVKEYIEKNDYKFIQHKNTCAGDGSVSLGQSVIASKLNQI